MEHIYFSLIMNTAKAAILYKSRIDSGELLVNTSGKVAWAAPAILAVTQEPSVAAALKSSELAVLGVATQPVKRDNPDSCVVTVVIKLYLRSTDGETGAVEEDPDTDEAMLKRELKTITGEQVAAKFLKALRSKLTEVDFDGRIVSIFYKEEEDV